jgi:histidinol-phosphate aminotransferase
VSLADRVKPWIAALAPYQPGKPIEELERELGISGAIKLASNENPFGPSPRALEAVRGALASVHRYPDGASFALRAKLADRLAVDPAQLVFGCGADELLELVAKSFLGPGDECVFAWPSFAMYPIVTKRHGCDARRGAARCRLRARPRRDGRRPWASARAWSSCATRTTRRDERRRRDARALRRAAARRRACWWTRRTSTSRAGRTSPTRSRSSRGGRRRFAMRTFSKIAGLAGLRVGYGIAGRELAGYLERARHPFNVNLLAEVAAVAALDDTEHLARTVKENAAGVDQLRRELAALGIETWPSEANFVLARPGPGTYERLLREGVIVRPLGGFGMPDHVRITVGLPEENERLVKALRRLVEERAS